jgi:hypothetical protein
MAVRVNPHLAGYAGSLLFSQVMNAVAQHSVPHSVEGFRGFRLNHSNAKETAFLTCALASGPAQGFYDWAIALRNNPQNRKTLQNFRHELAPSQRPQYFVPYRFKNQHMAIFGGKFWLFPVVKRLCCREVPLLQLRKGLWVGMGPQHTNVCPCQNRQL